MDPLLRAPLSLKRGATRVWGFVVTAVGAGTLVWWAHGEPPTLVSSLGLGVVITSIGCLGARRVRETAPDPREDLVLSSQLVILALAAVVASPGQLDGPYHAAIYAVLIAVAAFAGLRVTLFTVLFALALEGVLRCVVSPPLDWAQLLPHGALMGFFALLNLALFRSEGVRVRRLARILVEQEAERTRRTARSFRLLGVPGGSKEGGRTTAEPQLLQSAVDEVHAALRYALDMTRRSLGLRSAVLLWLDASEERLEVQEASSEAEVHLGPFGARDGICGAALARGQTVFHIGTKAASHVPYYHPGTPVGAVCATPILVGGTARGVLVVDREAPVRFSSNEEASLMATTEFVLRAIENERIFLELERTQVEQGKLYRATDALSAATTETEVIEAGVSSAREFAAFDLAIVTLFDRSSAIHEICAVSGDGAAHLADARFHHNGGLVSMVVANRHALPYRGDFDPECQVVFSPELCPPPMGSLLVLPLLVHDRALGTLILGSRGRHAFGDAVRTTLEVLARHVAVSLANARMLQSLEELATTDGLTGVLNKRALLDQAHRKLKSAERYRRPLALLVCDIDHFKRVNDTHGHDVGDTVIRGLAELLKRAKRDTDIVGRFGGEEFVVLCEETDAEGAVLLAERIRSELASTTFHTEGGPLKVTCSVGVAPFPAAGKSWEALFKATDGALYASKRNGRNRVTTWSARLEGCVA